MACSHPERIVTLSQQVAAGAALLQEQSDTARRAVASVGSAWHGSTASLFEGTGAHLATELARKAAVLSDIASTLMDMASTLDDAHVLWHQAEIAQSAAVAGALPGMPIDNSESESLAAQAREHVTLAVQRGVLAFSAVTEDTWYFSGRAFGGLVHAIEQELTHQWRVPAERAEVLGHVSAVNGVFVEQIVRSLNRGRSRSGSVYVVPDAAQLAELFERLTSGGLPTAGTAYPGRLLRLSDGTRIGLRQHSKSGGPAIDIWPASGGELRVHVRQ